jgi:DNA replication protein DnaC
MKTYKEAYTLLLHKQNNYYYHQRQKKELLYKKIPELSNLDQQINHLGVSLIRETIQDNHQEIETIRKKMEELENEKRILAKEEVDLLTPSYFCPLCKDKGMIDHEICQCLGLCLSESSFSGYDLKEKAQHETFDSFNIEYYSDRSKNPNKISPQANATKIKNLILKYCRNFDVLDDQLLFIGSPGVGKTFMSNCIVNFLTPKGYGIIYVTASHLVSSIQDQIFRLHKTASEVLEPLILCDLLIIDDLGAEYSSEYSQKQLYEVIDTRLNSGKKMIISTNLSILNIKATYDERLSSRIQGNFKAIPFVGDDIRLIKARQKKG